MYNIYFWLQMKSTGVKISLALFVLVKSVMAAYNPILAEKLYYMASCTYCNQDLVTTWQCVPCLVAPIEFTKVTPFYNETGNCLGLVGILEQIQSVAILFRGTIPWDVGGWFHDFDALKVPYDLCDNDCEVHHGFYILYKQVAKSIRSAVKNYQFKYGYSKVTIIGHSLGGALAIHSIADFIAHDIKITQVYSFGGPRIGDSKFVEWFSRKIGQTEVYRVTHNQDAVAIVPPPFLGYLHPPNQIFYKGHKEQGYRICKDSATEEDPLCSSQFKNLALNVDHFTYFDTDLVGSVLICE